MDDFWMQNTVMVLTNALTILLPLATMGILMFFLQRQICRSDGCGFCKLIPGIVLLILSGVCVWQGWLWNNKGHTLYFVISFLAGLGLGCMLLGCIAAWAVFAFDKYVKKEDKNL